MIEFSHSKQVFVAVSLLVPQTFKSLLNLHFFLFFSCWTTRQCLTCQTRTRGHLFPICRGGVPRHGAEQRHQRVGVR